MRRDSRMLYLLVVSLQILTITTVLYLDPHTAAAQHERAPEAKSKEERDRDRDREREAKLTEEEKRERFSQRVISAREQCEKDARRGKEVISERDAQERFGLKGRDYELVRDAIISKKLFVIGQSMARVVPFAMEIGGATYPGRDVSSYLSNQDLERLAEQRIETWRVTSDKNAKLEPTERLAKAKVEVARILELPYLGRDVLRNEKAYQGYLDRADNRGFIIAVMRQNCLILDIGRDPLQSEESKPYKAELQEIELRGSPNYIKMDQKVSDRIGIDRLLGRAW